MKKILFYFNSMTPAGGIERVISTLANHFCEFMDVTILVKDKNYSHYPLSQKIKLISINNTLDLDMDCKLKRIGQATINLLKSSLKLKHFLKSENFDFYYIAHPLNALEFHLAYGINKKVIITEHGAHDAYNIIYRKLKSWLYPKAYYYIVPTTIDERRYKNLGFPVMYIPHFKSNLPYEHRILKEKIVLNIGRMTETKQQWILIDLWNDIVNIHNIKDWQLHLVGDGNLKQDYITKIDDYKLQEFIKIYPTTKNIADHYKKAAFFLLTSKSEGFGMVLLEAISFGLPCITYESPPGPPDIIQNDQNGYLIPMNDYDALKEKTIFLMQNCDKIKELSLHAYTSSFKWSNEMVIAKWKKILL